MIFDHLLKREGIWKNFTEAYKNNKIPNAYILFGDEGVGKEALSVELAGLLNCKRPINNLNACGGCRSCISIKSFQHEDVHFIHPLPAKKNNYRLDHKKTHWASASGSLPDPLSSSSLQEIIASLPNEILRVKGCTKLDKDAHYTHFEKTPKDLDLIVRPYYGKLVSGPVILTVGPGSDPIVLEKIVSKYVLYT